MKNAESPSIIAGRNRWHAILLTGALSFSSGLISADAQEAEATPAPATTTEAVRVYSPVAKSFFEPGQEERNPFWPIGWQPQSEVVEVVREVQPLESIPPNLFRLSSILTGSPAIAIIDGKDYMINDILTKEVQGQTVKFRVMAIRDGQVVLGYPGGNVVISN